MINAITCIELISKTKMQLPSFVSTFIVCFVKKKKRKRKSMDSSLLITPTSTLPSHEEGNRNSFLSGSRLNIHGNGPLPETKRTKYRHRMV